MNCLLLPSIARYWLQITDVLNTMYIIIMLFILYSDKLYTVFNDTCTRSAARYRNDSERFLVAFSRSWNKFYVKSLKRPYIYDIHTEGGRWGVLTLDLCLQILLFLNNRSMVHFREWRVGGGHKIGKFLWTS